MKEAHEMVAQNNTATEHLDCKLVPVMEVIENSKLSTLIIEKKYKV